MKHGSLFLVALLAAGCGSSPEDVCDHTLQLLDSAGARAEVLSREECVADMAANKERANWVQWMRFSSCVTDQTDFEGVADCSPLLRS